MNALKWQVGANKCEKKNIFNKGITDRLSLDFRDTESENYNSQVVTVL